MKSNKIYKIMTMTYMTVYLIKNKLMNTLIMVIFNKIIMIKILYMINQKINNHRFRKI